MTGGADVDIAAGRHAPTRRVRPEDTTRGRRSSQAV